MQNPSNYVSGVLFTLLYKIDKNIAWIYSSDLKYYISEAPPLMQLFNFNVSDNNIKNAATYNYSLVSSKDFLQVPNLAISIKLPPVYKDVISYQGLSTASSSTDQSSIAMNCLIQSSSTSSSVSTGDV